VMVGGGGGGGGCRESPPCLLVLGTWGGGSAEGDAPRLFLRRIFENAARRSSAPVFVAMGETPPEVYTQLTGYSRSNARPSMRKECESRACGGYRPSVAHAWRRTRNVSARPGRRRRRFHAAANRRARWHTRRPRRTRARRVIDGLEKRRFCCGSLRARHVEHAFV